MTSNEVRQAPISRRRTLSVLVVALVSTLATAQQPELPPATRTRLEGAISRFMSASGIPGWSVAVVLSGQHVWSKGFGFADLENNVPVTSQTLFRLASVSKPITATYPAPHPFLFQVKIGQYRQPDSSIPVTKFLGAGTTAGFADVGHGGGQQGTSTFIMLAPQQRAGVVVLINLDGADASALAADLMRMLIGAAEKAK